MLTFNLENLFGLYDNASDLASWLQVLRRQIAVSQAKRDAEIWNWAIMENCAWMRWSFGWSHRACWKTEDCACSGPHGGKHKYLPPWEQTFLIFKNCHHKCVALKKIGIPVASKRAKQTFIESHLKCKCHCSLRLITNYWCQFHKNYEYRLMWDGNYFWRKMLAN